MPRKKSPERVAQRQGRRYEEEERRKLDSEPAHREGSSAPPLLDEIARLKPDAETEEKDSKHARRSPD